MTPHPCPTCGVETGYPVSCLPCITLSETEARSAEAARRRRRRCPEAEFTR